MSCRGFKFPPWLKQTPGYNFPTDVMYLPSQRMFLAWLSVFFAFLTIRLEIISRGTEEDYDKCFHGYTTLHHISC